MGAIMLNRERELYTKIHHEQKLPDELLAFEGEILAALLSKGEYSGSIDNDRLSMVAGEIFDTILFTNVPVAHYKLLEVQTKIHDG